MSHANINAGALLPFDLNYYPEVRYMREVQPVSDSFENCFRPCNRDEYTMPSLSHLSPYGSSFPQSGGATNVYAALPNSLEIDSYQQDLLGNPTFQCTEIGVSLDHPIPIHDVPQELWQLPIARIDSNEEFVLDAHLQSSSYLQSDPNHSTMRPYNPSHFEPPPHVDISLNPTISSADMSFEGLAMPGYPRVEPSMRPAEVLLPRVTADMAQELSYPSSPCRFHAPCQRTHLHHIALASSSSPISSNPARTLPIQANVAQWTTDDGMSNPNARLSRGRNGRAQVLSARMRDERRMQRRMSPREAERLRNANVHQRQQHGKGRTKDDCYLGMDDNGQRTCLWDNCGHKCHPKDMARHIKQRHVDMGKPFFCLWDGCNHTRLRSYDGLTRHIQVHVDKVVMCLYCHNKAFSRTDRLNLHIREVHPQHQMSFAP